ncbi:MAG: hypothetical protein ACMXYB_04700 [Candidatus Woesearchaeota archaeon]
MVSSVKFLITVIAVMLSLAFVNAASFTVESMNIQNVNDEFIVTLTMQNENVSSGVFTDVFFEVEGVVTRQSVTVDQATSIQSFKLRDVLSNYDSLVVGNSYRLSVEVGNTSVNQSFIFNTMAEESGLPVSINSIEVNGNRLNDFSSLSVQNGGTVEVTISFIGQRDADNARFRADIQGYEQAILEDSTSLFRVRQGVASSQTLRINLPADMSSQREYILRVYGSNDLSGLTYREYSLFVDTQRHRVDIVDLVMSPSTGVEPGQAVIANVRVNNRGQQNQGTVKTIVEVPELNIRAESFLTNLNVGEARTSEDMYLGVPRDAEPGIYTANVYTQYNDGFTQSKAEFDFVVLAPLVVQDSRLIISTGNIGKLEAGRTTSFDVIIVNPTTQSRAISIVPNDMSWASVNIEPSISAIGAGSDRTFRVDVTPKSDAKGTQTLRLLIRDENNVVQDLSIPVSIQESKEDRETSWNWINIALIVFIIVMLLILLLLLITVLRGRNSNDSKESVELEHDEADEYY